MNFVDSIIKKRDGGKLTKEEIAFFVKGVTDGTLPDYQISALLMAIFLKGMDTEETADHGNGALRRHVRPLRSGRLQGG